MQPTPPTNNTSKNYFDKDYITTPYNMYTRYMTIEEDELEGWKMPIPDSMPMQGTFTATQELKVNNPKDYKISFT